MASRLKKWIWSERSLGDRLLRYFRSRCDARDVAIWTIETGSGAARDRIEASRKRSDFLTLSDFAASEDGMGKPADELNPRRRPQGCPKNSRRRMSIAATLPQGHTTEGAYYTQPYCAAEFQSGQCQQWSKTAVSQGQTGARHFRCPSVTGLNSRSKGFPGGCQQETSFFRKMC